MRTLSKKKFLSLTTKRQHKHAASILCDVIEGKEDLLPLYFELTNIFSLPKLETTKKRLLERIYFHQTEAKISYPDQYTVSTKDTVSDTPFLEVDIYLENLRSMHNIGAILRTVEAFRLGKVYISKALPPSAIKKIKKTAMGADEIIILNVSEEIPQLKKPIIAIETSSKAQDCNTFAFPKSFTLLFGNEKYGLSEESLSKACHHIHIPLYGNKNSLNVSAAFSIIANCIRSS